VTNLNHVQLSSTPLFVYSATMLVMLRLIFIFLLFLLHYPLVMAATSCDKNGVWLQVLGSGGPEITDQRASSGYLIWHNGRARVLVDMGGGSLLRFEQTGADINDLDMILLTHLHVDHSADLPYLVKASYFTGRSKNLPIYGPTGNDLMPDTTVFIDNLFSKQGAFRYLSDYLDGSESWRLIAHDVNAGRETNSKSKRFVARQADIQISAVPVHHGPVPALAWRVDIAARSIVFSGDMNNDYDTLAGLAKNADLFIAHHAIPEQAGNIARNLHMPPSVIGKIAAQANVRSVVLSHRMLRTLGVESQSTQFIRQSYTGPLHFADDLQCYRP